MNKYGGIRNLLRDVDFKYIEDPTRIIWSKSVIQNVQKIVDLVTTIPYNNFRYDGDIYFEILKTKDISEEEDPNKEEIEENDGYIKINIAETLQNEVNVIQKNKYTENLITYNFFGGTVYELLNDNYKNVNLHKYVDPTSDIDVLLLTNYDIIEYLQKKINLDEKEGYYFQSKYTLICQNENGILMINPYTKNIADFLYEHLLNKLNELNLYFDNSVPFNDDEYYAIDDTVRNIDLGYRSNEIGETNAKLISYFDENFQTFRIQLVLKIQSGEHQIIDHFLEFLIGYNKYNDKPSALRLSMNDKVYQISSLYELFFDNLEAYQKRESLIIRNTIETRHKGINHSCRFIYLLDLIKNNNIFNDLLNDRNQTNLSKQQNKIRQIKQQISSVINKYINDSYIIYFYIDGKNIYKKIESEYIIKAFESIFRDMYNAPTKSLPVKLNKFLEKIKDPKLTEEKMYDMLSRFFNLNSSPLRHFIMNSPQNINLIHFSDKPSNGDIENYRERMNELIVSLNNAISIEERNELTKKIKELEQEFKQNMPSMSVNENIFKGGKRNNKSKKKYRNKLRIKKYKNTRRTRRRN